MKKPPESPTFARFTAAMQTIMKVPKTAMQKAREGEIAAKQASKVSKAAQDSASQA